MDLELGERQLRLGLLRLSLIGTRIEFQKQITLTDLLVVLHVDRGDRPADLRTDADHVGPHLGILGPGIDLDV